MPPKKRDIQVKLYIDGGLVQSTVVLHGNVGATLSSMFLKDRDGRKTEQNMSFADFVRPLCLGDLTIG